jgi:hypothetical protein
VLGSYPRDDDSVKTRPVLVLLVGEAFGVLAREFGDDRASHFARRHDARAVALDVGGAQALGPSTSAIAASRRSAASLSPNE